MQVPCASLGFWGKTSGTFTVGTSSLSSTFPDRHRGEQMTNITTQRTSTNIYKHITSWRSDQWKYAARHYPSHPILPSATEGIRHHPGLRYPTGLQLSAKYSYKCESFLFIYFTLRQLFRAGTTIERISAWTSETSGWNTTTPFGWSGHVRGSEIWVTHRWNKDWATSSPNFHVGPWTVYLALRSILDLYE